MVSSAVLFSFAGLLIFLILGANFVLGINKPKPNLPLGCWFDTSRGIYIGESVQESALAYGWSGAIQYKDDEHYLESWDDAADYLENLCPPGYWFGGNDNGDWGVWPDEDLIPHELT